MSTPYSAILRNVGMKVTPKRVAILEVLNQEDRYLSPEETWMRLKARFTRIGLPTVYRNLEDLSTAGVITKVIHPNRQLYYYFCPNQGHHHHFICVACHRVQDVISCVSGQIEEEVSRTLEGKVLSHILQVDGLCRDCVMKGSLPDE